MRQVRSHWGAIRQYLACLLSCFWYCIAATQKYPSRRFAVSGGSAQARRCGGRSNSGVRPDPSLGRGRYVPFSGIKKSSLAKNFQTKSWRFTSGQLQKRKTNCGCELRNSNFSRKSLTTKNATRISRAVLDGA